jgi:hypothetical protein
MGCRDDVEVIGSTVVLVILGMMSEFSVMHLTKLYCLGGVIGVQGIQNSVVAVILGMMLDLHFISYRMTLLLAASEDAYSSYLWRLSSNILSYVANGVLLLVRSGVSQIVGDVVGNITGGITDSVGGSVGQLHDFVLTTSLFSHGLKRSIAVMMMTARSL